MRTHTGSEPYNSSVYHKCSNATIDRQIHADNKNQNMRSGSSAIDGHRNKIVYNKNNIDVIQENPNLNRYLNQPFTFNSFGVMSFTLVIELRFFCL